MRSQRFKAKFPELGPKQGKPTASKKGFFKRMSRLMIGVKDAAEVLNLDEEDPEEVQTIEYCDTDVLGEGAVSKVPLPQTLTAVANHRAPSFPLTCKSYNRPLMQCAIVVRAKLNGEPVAAKILKKPRWVPHQASKRITQLAS